MDTKTPILNVNEVTKTFPGVVALDKVSFDIRPGEVHALVGENGAGKSTTLKAVSGLLKTEDGEVTKGTIHFKGESIGNRAPDDIVRRGIFQVMEGRRIIEDMTVIENLRLGAYTRPARSSKADMAKVSHYSPRPRERPAMPVGNS